MEFLILFTCGISKNSIKYNYEGKKNSEKHIEEKEGIKQKERRADGEGSQLERES